MPLLAFVSKWFTATDVSNDNCLIGHSSINKLIALQFKEGIFYL